MKRQNLKPFAMTTALLLGLSGVAIVAAQSGDTGALSYPPTKTVDVVDEYHGVAVKDPYRWLENSDDPAVDEWQWAQDAVTSRYLDSPERQKIHAATYALQSIEKLGFARRVKGKSYYGRFTTLPGDLEIFERADGQPERALLSPPEYGLGPVGEKGRRYRQFTPDHQGRYVAVSYSDEGSRWLKVAVLDTETDERLSDHVDGLFNMSSSVVWRTDQSGFYYIKFERRAGTGGEEDQAISPSLWFHALGTDQAEDVMIRTARGETTVPVSYASSDGELLVIEWRKSEVIEADIEILKQDDHLGESYKPFDEAASYNFLESMNGTLYFYTNLDAPKGRIIGVDYNDTLTPNYREIISEQDDAIYDNSQFGFGLMGVMGGKLVVSYVSHGSPYIKIYDLDGNHLQDINIMKGAMIAGMAGTPDDDKMLVTQQHLAVPNSNYILDLETYEMTRDASQKLPFDPEMFITEQVLYESHDGTKVPMYVMRRKDVALDGEAPFYMYAYGSHAWNGTLWYRNHVLLWLLNGGVYVQPGIRGGGEYGAEWTNAGRKVNRENTIKDYMAAAEWLIKKGWARSDRFVANGGSASGFLPAVSIQRRPDLFAAAIVDYPVLDYLRHEKFSSGSFWTGDSGSVSDPEVFPVLNGYSPVHNAKAGTCYPATIVMMGQYDSVSHPAHARKWVGAMQNAQACDKPMLLNVLENAGHNYGNTIESSLKSEVDHSVFLMKYLDFPMDWQPGD